MTIDMRVAGAITAAGASVLAAPALSGIPPITHRLPAYEPGIGSRPRIVLTFDDGPHPDGTRAILDILGENQVPAIFFVVGEQLRRFPDVGSRIAVDGHRIEVHGWTHRCMLTVAPRKAREQIAETADLIETITGTRPTRYRPPYGVASLPALSACRALHLRPAWWTVWGRDWDRDATAESVHRRIARRIGPERSATILLHDSDTYGTYGSWRATAAALTRLLGSCAARGITIGRPQA